KPVGEHGNADEESGAPPGGPETRKCAQGNGRSECRPGDACQQPVRKRKPELRLMCAGHVGRQSNRFPTEQYEYPQQKIQQQGGGDEYPNADSAFSPPNSQGNPNVSCKHDPPST